MNTAEEPILIKKHLTGAFYKPLPLLPSYVSNTLACAFSSGIENLFVCMTSNLNMCIVNIK